MTAGSGAIARLAGVARLPARRPDAIVFAGLTIFVVLFFADATLRGRAFYYRDLHLQWQPQVEAFVSVVHAGSWPLWTPYMSFGQPLLANPNNQVVYPLTWLNLLLPFWRYYTLYVVAHFAGSAAGFYLLARKLKLSRLASVLGAVVWIASGPFASLVNLWNHLGGFAWMPWSAVCALNVCRHGRARDAVLWGATLAAPVLAGSPESGLACGLAAMTCAAPELTRSGSDRRAALRLARGSAIAGVFALGLSAAQALPSLDVASRSIRAELGKEQSDYWSVHPANLAQLALPVFLDGLPLREEVRRTLFENREPFLTSFYLGLSSIGLIAAGVAARGSGRLYAGLGLLGAGLALGRHSALWAAAQGVVPLLANIRFPAKALLLTAFAWALLAGLGFDVLRDVRARRFVRSAAAIAWVAALLVGFASWWAARRYAPTWGNLIVEAANTRRPLAVVLQPVSRQLLFAAGCAFLAWLLSEAIRRWPGVAALPAGLAALVGCDLWLAHRGINPTVDKEFYAYRPPALEAFKGAGDGRVYSYDYFFDRRLGRDRLGHAPYLLKVPREDWPEPWAEAVALRTGLYPSVLPSWRIEGAFAGDPVGVFPIHLLALNSFVRMAEGTPTHHRLLRMGAVTHVVTLHTWSFEELREIGTFESLYVEPVRVLAVDDALARTYVVSGARIANEQAALTQIAESSFDPTREIVLPEGTARAPLPGFRGSSRIVERLPDRVVLDVDLSDPGYVVLIDTYDPGWRVRLDGQRADLLRANAAFRAVAVPPGRHRLEMVYRPAAVVRGLWIGSLALILSLGVLCWRSPARRHAGEATADA